MKNLGLVITSLLLWTVNCDIIVTRTFRWTNLDDFLAAGFKPSNNLVQKWSSPTDVDPRLTNLTRDFTDNVWGWKAKTSSEPWNFFGLNSSLPEYCGIINATLEVKFYFTGNETRNYLNPIVGPSSDPTLYFQPNPVVEWQTVSAELNTSYAEVFNLIALRYYTQLGELFIYDEITLTYSANQDGENCPYSCDQDCEYRAIDCHQYYTCVDRKYREIHSCSKEEGLAFNPLTKTCDLLENVEGCRSEPEICVCAYKPHETNCSSYYFCNNTCIPEECEERHCPSGLMWSTDALGDGSGLQQCVHSANATCQSESKKENSTIKILLPTEFGNSGYDMNNGPIL